MTFHVKRYDRYDFDKSYDQTLSSSSDVRSYIISVAIVTDSNDNQKGSEEKKIAIRMNAIYFYSIKYSMPKWKRIFT